MLHTHHIRVDRLALAPTYIVVSPHVSTPHYTPSRASLINLYTVSVLALSSPAVPSAFLRCSYLVGEQTDFLVSL